MAATLTIRDETTAPAEEKYVFELEFTTQSITVAELIRERVYQEVDDYSRWARGTSEAPWRRWLIEASDTERRLNGERVGGSLEIDWKQQFEVAKKAYQQGRILVLVGDRQTQSLDEVIEIRPDVEVTFLRLVQLVGG
jgi:hypothetical protein